MLTYFIIGSIYSCFSIVYAHEKIKKDTPIVFIAVAIAVFWPFCLSAVLGMFISGKFKK